MTTKLGKWNHEHITMVIMGTDTYNNIPRGHFNNHIATFNTDPFLFIFTNIPLVKTMLKTYQS